MPLPDYEESRTADMVLGMPTAARPSKTFFDHWKADDLGPKSFRSVLTKFGISCTSPRSNGRKWSAPGWDCSVCSIVEASWLKKAGDVVTAVARDLASAP